MEEKDERACARAQHSLQILLHREEAYLAKLISDADGFGLFIELTNSGRHLEKYDRAAITQILEFIFTHSHTTSIHDVISPFISRLDVLWKNEKWFFEIVAGAMNIRTLRTIAAYACPSISTLFLAFCSLRTDFLLDDWCNKMAFKFLCEKTQSDEVAMRIIPHLTSETISSSDSTTIYKFAKNFSPNSFKELLSRNKKILPKISLAHFGKVLIGAAACIILRNECIEDWFFKTFSDKELHTLFNPQFHRLLAIDGKWNVLAKLAQNGVSLRECVVKFKGKGNCDVASLRIMIDAGAILSCDFIIKAIEYQRSDLVKFACAYARNRGLPQLLKVTSRSGQPPLFLAYESMAHHFPEEKEWTNKFRDEVLEIPSILRRNGANPWEDFCGMTPVCKLAKIAKGTFEIGMRHESMHNSAYKLCDCHEQIASLAASELADILKASMFAFLFVRHPRLGEKSPAAIIDELVCREIAYFLLSSGFP